MKRTMPNKMSGVILRIAPWIVLLLFPVTLWAVFFWVPTDAFLGLSQRIFYYHVPSAITCFLAFISGGVASAVFLKNGEPEWDHAAHAAIGVGLLFGSILLVTGSVWARTAWGTWWTWDARLTTFLVLWLIFASYLLLRMMAEDNEMMPRYAAVLAIVGCVNIPVVQMATRLWRTIHPQVIRNPQGGINDPAMQATLGLCLVAFITMFAWLWSLRFRVLRLTERAELLLEDNYRGGQGT
jgi:heme exporter protein C